MPALPLKPTTHPLVKAFFMGMQGQGKSGSTVPLALKGPIRGLQSPAEGFELRVLDFDGKYEEIARAVLGHMVTKGLVSAAQASSALSHIDVRVCRERTGIVKGVANKKSISKIGIQGSTSAWTNAVKQLEKWQIDFSPSSILIIDSLTHAAQVAANFSQELNGRFNQSLSWQNFNEPQQLIAMLMTIAADLPCHTIICAHQTPIEVYRKLPELDDEGKPVEEHIDTYMAPVSIGKAGNLQLPSQFNHCLVAAEEGKGGGVKRYIHTSPVKGVMTKTPFFGAKAKYPIETGWVEYMALRK